jgi:hypothetical protein
VPGNPVENGANGKVVGPRSLHDEVLLAVHDCAGVGKVEEDDAGVRVLAGDGLMAEVETESPG